jgi:Gluconate 2-dehydrogenase subunit 3
VNKLPPSELADQITRRHWLLRLGETVALAGVSGGVPTAVAERLVAATKSQGTSALPPGLYVPSADHLAHALAAKESYVSRPGSETEYVQLMHGPYRPQFFSEQDFQIVTRLVGIILGQVDPSTLSQTAQWVDFWLYSAAGVLEAAQQLNPLHRSLAVAYYGDAVVKELETSNPQLVARQGIPALNELSMARHGKGFLEISEPDQIKLIEFISRAQPHDPLRKFFDLIRKETILGYYTSAEGLKELDHKGNTYHGQCPGCTINRATLGNM